MQGGIGNEGEGERGRVSGRQSWWACAETPIPPLPLVPVVLGQWQDTSFLSHLSITNLSLGPGLYSVFRGCSRLAVMGCGGGLGGGKVTSPCASVALPVKGEQHFLSPETEDSGRSGN